ncbi:MAG: F0F1 ATP synthase subunit delta [Candidatus Omnitrophica bacterium]|nr:F0F1 ATP synthase subunit delta [Candidatus Omnitrophota bacterium]
MLIQLVLLQVGFFVVLLLVMRRVFHGHLLDAVKRVNKLHEMNLQKEEKLNVYEIQMQKRREEKLKSLDAEIQKRRAAAETEIKTMMERMRVELGREKEALEAQVEEAKASLERKMDFEARRRGASFAAQIIEQGFSERMLRSIHDCMADDLLGSLEAAAGKATPGSVPSVRTAFELTARQKEEIKAKLACAADPAVEPDASLLAGFIITIGEVVFDGSLRHYFEKQSSAMSEL